MTGDVVSCCDVMRMRVNGAGFLQGPDGCTKVAGPVPPVPCEGRSAPTALSLSVNPGVGTAGLRFAVLRFGLPRA